MVMTLVVGVVTMRMRKFLGLSSLGNRINSSHLVGSAWFFTKAVRLWESEHCSRLWARLAFPGGVGPVVYHSPSLLHPTPSLATPLGEGWVPEEGDASCDSPAVHPGLLLSLGFPSVQMCRWENGSLKAP